MTYYDVLAISLNELIEINRYECLKTNEPHLIRDGKKLSSLLESGVFYRDHNGKYIQGSISVLAGVLCYRIAQAQSFLNGNKRTAYLATRIFLERNGFCLKAPFGDIEDLIRGFAEPQECPRYSEEDAKNWFSVHVFLQTTYVKFD